MKKNKIFTAITVLLLSFVYQGCTNLDEVVYDQLPTSEFGTTSKEIASLVGPIYRTYIYNFPSGFFYLSEAAGDMSVVPTRKGGDWWDGGAFKEFRMHTWTANSSMVRSPYNYATSGISVCNKIYTIVNESTAISDEDKTATLAEIRGVRAFWYYLLCDNYGNVPIVTDFKDISNPETKTRKEVYEFVLSELNDIKDVVRSDVSTSSYGKITRGVVYTMLAKMYLNAMVWNPEGGPKWQECIDACDEVMKLPYIIEPDFKASFATDNENSNEIIFPIVYDASQGPNCLQLMTLHNLDRIALNLNCSPWNGVCAMPGYVKAYDPEDLRLGWSFLTGKMIDPSTNQVLITSQGRELNHTIDVSMIYSVDADGWGQVEQEDGARCFKWEYASGLGTYMDNDLAIFRLADVYLMKAECLVRLDQDNAEATRLVNVIRGRAFTDPAKLLPSVTLENIYNERRFELAWEMTCRQDMIRFGTFLNPISGWKEYTSDSKYLLFPIPQTALDANPSLTQNPGY